MRSIVRCERVGDSPRPERRPDCETATPPRLAFRFASCEPTLPLQGRGSGAAGVILTFAAQSACLAPPPKPTHLPGSNVMSFVLAIDQGTTSSRAIVFRADISIAATAQAGIPAAFSGLGLGRARAGGHLDLDHRDLPRGAAQRPASPRATSPPSASPTSARPRWCGTAPPARPSTAPSSGRTAAPPTSARSLKAEGHEPLISAQDRPDHRSLFLRHQDRLDPRPRAGRARARRARRTGVRHRRLLSACGG